MDAINDPGVADIYVGFSSSGGNVHNGIALYHSMRACPKEITMHGLGNVDSIGLTVFLGAKKRYAVPGTRFTFHSIGNNCDNRRMDISWINEKLSSLRIDETRLTSIWESSETKLSHDEAIALFEREYMHDCAWAIAHGFIQEVRDFWMPGTARIRQLA